MTRVKKEKIKILHSKFRFSVFNDTSHEELFVFRAKGLMFILSICLTVIFIIISVTILISYTPLREFIPGYPNAQTRRAIVEAVLWIMRTGSPWRDLPVELGHWHRTLS